MTKYTKPNLKKEYEKIGKKVINILKICTDIVQKVPKASDSTMEKVVKTGSIIESVYRLATNVDYESLTLYMHKQYNAKVVSSSFLTKLMSQIELDPEIDIELTHTPDKANRLRHIIQDNNERLVFVESKDETPDRALHNYFFVTPNFNFPLLFSCLWKKVGNCVSVEYITDTMFSKQLQFTPSVVDLTFFSQQTSNKVVELSDFKVGNVALLVGPPGTGKTGFSHYFAKLNDKKLFKLTGSVFDEGRTTDVCNLFNFIKPEIVLIDDFDRTGLCSANASSLYFFELLHHQFPDILFILTANYPKRIEKALLRTGRIDHVMEFNLPEKDERANILAHYLKTQVVDNMLTATEGFSHSDVVSFAKRINAYGFDLAYNAMDRLTTYRKDGKVFGDD